MLDVMVTRVDNAPDEEVVVMVAASVQREVLMVMFMFAT